MRSDSLSRIDRYKRLIDLRNRQREIPLPDFCRKNGISPWSYYFWRKKLAALNGKAHPLATEPFVPLPIVSQSTTSYSFEVMLPNGIVIRSRQQLDGEMMATLAGIRGA